MQCPHCGASNPDGYTNCASCGAPAHAQPSPRPSQPAWHQRTLVYHYRRGEGGSRVAVDGQDALAQQAFWNDLLRLFLDHLETTMQDHGWSPVGAHGPSCIELDQYTTANILDAIEVVSDAFSDHYRGPGRNPWRWTVKAVSLRYRRPTEGHPIEDTFHYWQGQEGWQRHDLDSRGQFHAADPLPPWHPLRPEAGGPSQQPADPSKPVAQSLLGDSTVSATTASPLRPQAAHKPAPTSCIFVLGAGIGCLILLMGALCVFLWVSGDSLFGFQ